MSKRTPIDDTDKKLDVIEHINNDHPEELMAIVADYVDESAVASTKLDDVFEEGCLVSVHMQNGQPLQSLFVPFQIKGDIEEQLLYLAYVSMVKQGKSINRGKKQYFEVVSKETLSANMLRLVLKSPQPIPENTPGFAYGFMLKTLEQAPNPASNQPVNRGKTSGFLTRLSERAFLWILKVMSSKQRQRVLESFGKGMRYYTLRKAFKSSEQAEFTDTAWVDVFLHGETEGSRWATQLQNGDIIHSNAEYHAKYDYLSEGQAVLIADETAYPALAAIIETWNNPQPPVVMVLSAHQDEQTYILDNELPKGVDCRRLVGTQAELWEQLKTQLDSLSVIDVTWGALESSMAKKIRSHLRNERGLSGKQNRVKAYWKL